MDVHVRDLRYFVAVAEELSFTRGAARVFVSQPALSKQIRVLESQLGVQLFVRDRRSVALTAAAGVHGRGHPAYSSSKAALNALTRMLADELRAERILVNSVCPGWVATDMGGPGGRPVAEGAASVLWAVDLPDDGPTGGFSRDGAPLPW